MSEIHKNLALQYSASDWSFSSARAWETVVQSDPSPLNLMAFAEQLRLSGQFSKALVILNQLTLSTIPKEFQYLLPLRRGLIYQDSGRLKEAILAFQESVTFQPQETYPYVFLAVALTAQERLEEAGKVLENALHLSSDLDEVWYNLALVYARMGNWMQAIFSMQECLKLSPDFPNARTWLDDLEQRSRIASGSLADYQVLPGATKGDS